MQKTQNTLSKLKSDKPSLTSIHVLLLRIESLKLVGFPAVVEASWRSFISHMNVPGQIIQVSACNRVAELEHGVVLLPQYPQCPSPSLLFHTVGWGQREKKSLRIKAVSEH